MAGTTRTDVAIPALLIALSAVPTLGGFMRLLGIARDTQVTPENARFLAAPGTVTCHVVSATLFCLLGAFQLSPAFRLRRPRRHRRLGALFVLCGVSAALSALWMTMTFRIPALLQGPLLYGARIAVASAMLAFIVLACVSIACRRGQRHGDFMIRAYALGQGAGTQALVLVPWIAISGESQGPTRDILMISAWAINVAVAEVFIRTSRPDRARPTARSRTWRSGAS